MHDEFEQHRRSYYDRKRRMRRLLKLLPRRAAMARSRLPRWLRSALHKSWFLWSFKRGPVLRAVYFGSVLALLPLMGIQLFLSALLCLGVRANFPITAALQFITNPFTMVPVYGLTYLVGYTLMNVLSSNPEPYVPGAALAMIAAGEFSGTGDIVLALLVGGVVVGLAVALLIDFGWRLVAWEARIFKARFDRLRTARKAREAGEAPPG
jgi:uncharacterized protein (DUF2062 family)